MPKCQNINASKSLILEAPPKSIGFYVVPNANISTCCCNEHNHVTTTPENTGDQYDNENKVEKQLANMDVLAKVIENELLTYEAYIKNPAEWRRLLQNNIPGTTEYNKNELPEELKRVIFERAKQKKALELEEKSKEIKHLLIERAKNEETKAKILSDIEKLKATEVEQAIDELINKNNDESKLREKRSLVTSNEDEVSWIQHEENLNAVPRPTRRIQNNLEERVSLDPVYEKGQEGGCACRRTGKCNCGKNYTNMFLKQMLQVLNKDEQQVEAKIENYEGSHQTQNKNEEMKEMKNLVSELKSIVTSMKYLEAQNKSNQFYYKQQNDDNDDNNVSEMIKVNLIPKDRLKRNTEENNDVFKEPTNTVSKKRNLSRKKRAPMTIKEDEVYTTMKTEEESNITTPKEEKPKTPETETETKTNDQPHNTKYKLLQRKLLHQEKLENQIETYLEKIRHHKEDLKNELERSLTGKQAHNKKYVKREIWDSDDEIIDNNEISEIETNMLNDITNENDMFLNEISKEGKNVPDFIKENEEATYKLRVKAVPKKRVNKIIKMFENGRQKSAANLKTKKKITKEPTTEVSSTAASEVYHDADGENTTTTATVKTTVQSNNDGFVDEAFRTLSQCLSEFHRKIVDFLRFLSP